MAITEEKRKQNSLNALKKANIKIKKKYEDNVKKYYLNPKLCLCCKKIIEYSKKSKNKYCSSKCRAKEINPTKGRNRTELEKFNISSALKGRKMTEQQKINISNRNCNKGKKMSESQKKLISKSLKKYYLNNPEVSKRHADFMKLKGHSKETREKMSKKRSEYLENVGQSGFKNIKNYNCKNILDEEFIVRGTWELKFAQWLNSKNIIWKRKIYFNYYDGEINRTYIPDFYILKENIYVEVKGYFKELDKKKMKLVVNQNNIKIMMCFKRHINNLNNYKNLDELFCQTEMLKNSDSLK